MPDNSSRSPARGDVGQDAGVIPRFPFFFFFCAVRSLASVWTGGGWTRAGCNSCLVPMFLAAQRLSGSLPSSRSTQGWASKICDPPGVRSGLWENTGEMGVGWGGVEELKDGLWAGELRYSFPL